MNSRLKEAVLAALVAVILVGPLAYWVLTDFAPLWGVAVAAAAAGGGFLVGWYWLAPISRNAGASRGVSNPSLRRAKSASRDWLGFAISGIVLTIVVVVAVIAGLVAGFGAS